MSTVTVTMCHDKISRKHSGNGSCPAVTAASQATLKAQRQLQRRPRPLWTRGRARFATWSTYMDRHKPWSPPWGFKRRLCWGDVLTKRSQWREGMHMTRLDRRGPAGDGGYIRSPMPWPSLRQTGGLSPNEPWPPLQDHNQQPRQPLGSFEVCVIGW